MQWVKSVDHKQNFNEKIIDYLEINFKLHGICWELSCIKSLQIDCQCLKSIIISHHKKINLARPFRIVLSVEKITNFQAARQMEKAHPRMLARLAGLLIRWIVVKVRTRCQSFLYALVQFHWRPIVKIMLGLFAAVEVVSAGQGNGHRTQGGTNGLKGAEYEHKEVDNDCQEVDQVIVEMILWSCISESCQHLCHELPEQHRLIICDVVGL